MKHTMHDVKEHAKKSIANYVGLLRSIADQLDQLTEGSDTPILSSDIKVLEAHMSDLKEFIGQLETMNENKQLFKESEFVICRSCNVIVQNIMKNYSTIDGERVLICHDCGGMAK